MADKEGFGFLYPKKDRSGGKPTMTGHVIIGGRKVELAAWGKKAQNSGVAYLSLKAQDKGPADEDVNTPATEDDDDIPF